MREPAPTFVSMAAPENAHRSFLLPGADGVVLHVDSSGHFLNDEGQRCDAYGRVTRPRGVRGAGTEKRRAAWASWKGWSGSQEWGASGSQDWLPVTNPLSPWWLDAAAATGAPSPAAAATGAPSSRPPLFTSPPGPPPGPPPAGQLLMRAVVAAAAATGADDAAAAATGADEGGGCWDSQGWSQAEWAKFLKDEGGGCWASEGYSATEWAEFLKAGFEKPQ